MKSASRCAALLALAVSTGAAAEEAWEFSLTAYPARVRDGESSTSAIGVASRGALHLEARYGYEAIDARSAFVGWTLSGGEAVTWEFRPLLGGAWGPVQAFVPGLETSVAWKRLDFYVEAEFVRDRRSAADNYNYAWSELGFRAFEWLRIGAAAQRTRTYGGEREFQRGPFAQMTFGRASLGGYWFNPGSKEQVVVASIGVKF